MVEDILREQLVVIDEVLARKNTPLAQRPLESSIIFVQECIVEIEGDTKKDFHSKPWFRPIYKIAETWYRERYGEALKNQGHDTATGVCLAYGSPFKLTIPLTATEVEESGKSAWLCFLIDVLPEEDVFSWLVAGPNVAGMPEAEKEALALEITSAATVMRKLRSALLTAECSGVEEESLRGSIEAHVAKAVADIVAIKHERISVAFWELNLAAEKLLKLLIRQAGQQPSRTHSLVKLAKQLASLGGPSYEACLFQAMPSDGEAINMRYGEGPSATVERAVEVYRATLRILDAYSAGLKRKYVLNGAKFLLKMPPWIAEEDQL